LSQAIFLRSSERGFRLPSGPSPSTSVSTRAPCRHGSPAAGPSLLWHPPSSSSYAGIYCGTAPTRRYSFSSTLRWKLTL